MSAVSSKVLSIIIDELGMDEDEVVPEARLVGDFGADDADLEQIRLQIEEEFNINVPSEDIDKFTTIGAIVSYVEARVKPA